MDVLFFDETARVHPAAAAVAAVCAKLLGERGKQTQAGLISLLCAQQTHTEGLSGSLAA